MATGVARACEAAFGIAAPLTTAALGRWITCSAGVANPGPGLTVFELNRGLFTPFTADPAALLVAPGGRGTASGRAAKELAAPFVPTGSGRAGSCALLLA